MIGLNSGLEIARKALSAYQLAISVYGNNIANVATPGFSRKRPEIRESEGLTISSGRVGLGVTTATIMRMRDTFLDRSYWDANATYGSYQSSERLLSQLEGIWGEQGEAGLMTILQDFWNSWQDLANNPESMTPRRMVIASSQTLCESLRRAARNMNMIRLDADNEIAELVNDINWLSSEIAELNEQIVRVETSGQKASDLRDKRDYLLDQLSEIASIQVFEAKDGSISVRMDGETLVERTAAVPISLVERKDGEIVVHDIAIGNAKRLITPSRGKIAGLLEIRDQTIPGYLAKLDSFASTLVERLNQRHEAGYGLDGVTGRSFFNPDGITASTISVSEDIINNPSFIAASSDGSPGNQENAIAIAALRLQGIFGNQEAISEDYIASMIGEIGSISSRASNQREAQELILKEIDNRRESAKGVNLDEEMANLIASQHAYYAAAKLVTVIDDLMKAITEIL
ncbi:MAG: flagellar hook-associated protein FlgK [bacterium]